MATKEPIAEVISVFPNKVRIAVHDIESFKVDDELLAVGSYLKIFDHKDCSIIAIIENFYIEMQSPDANGERSKYYIIEAIPLGIINPSGDFIRGGNNIAIPPKTVEPAKKADIQKIYNGIEENSRFSFSKLTQDQSINVPVDGNRLFNKHIAIVGSTGSGKSHTVAKVLQNAVEAKDKGYEGLNNSHIVIFDIHSEYKTAFPKANHINIENLKLPYWLFNSEELSELFIESNEENSHNQISQFRFAVTKNKVKHNPTYSQGKIYFDSPLRFKIEEVIRYIKNLDNEVIGKLTGEGLPKKSDGTLISSREAVYFDEDVEFAEKSTAAATKASSGPFNGDFNRFILRLEATAQNPRFSFLFKDVDSLSFEDVLKNIIGYTDGSESNVTVIDLNGIPFEVLSVTVSLISRILFEYGYYYKKILSGVGASETPVLLVYEEAHKYAPKTDLARFNSSRTAIERIAKEGRKYGVTCMIVSQRPSEISETIFSQCSNFIAMRLTNPNDQSYVKRLLPDTLGPLTESLPMLQAGEALLIGDCVVMPSLVKIDPCTDAPSSSDIQYLQEWKKAWKKVVFKTLIEKWES